MKKTNALRILDSQGIGYEVIEYDPNIEVDGVFIAKTNHLPIGQVFKTLVAEGKSKDHYVFLLPVDQELDLKKGANLLGEKSLSLLPLQELYPLTGYIRGGVSPIGMKKTFKTIIDSSAKDLGALYISAGQKGLQIKLDPAQLVELIQGEFQDIVKGGNK